MTTRTLTPAPLGNWRIGFAVLALCLLALPLIAMQFTAEVNWGAGDFVVAAGLLAALWAGIEITLRLARTSMGRLLAVTACVLAFLTIWAELAVGIFD